MKTKTVTYKRPTWDNAGNEYEDAQAVYHVVLTAYECWYWETELRGMAVNFYCNGQQVRLTQELDGRTFSNIPGSKIVSDTCGSIQQVGYDTPVYVELFELSSIQELVVLLLERNAALDGDE